MNWRETSPLRTLQPSYCRRKDRWRKIVRREASTLLNQWTRWQGKWVVISLERRSEGLPLTHPQVHLNWAPTIINRRNQTSQVLHSHKPAPTPQTASISSLTQWTAHSLRMVYTSIHMLLDLHQCIRTTTWFKDSWWRRPPKTSRSSSSFTR